MQRKPGFPVANCSIKMPENMSSMVPEAFHSEDDVEQQKRRQQLINFGHSQWGFNNWNWTVTKQELDFVDLNNGKYCAGVVAFVSVSIKNLEIHRENIGYATSIATTKGFAIYKSRKCAVTNALRETLLSFGGTVATELMELLDAHKPDLPAPGPITPAPIAPVTVAPIPVVPEPANENNQNLPNKAEPKNSPSNRNIRKDADPAANMRSPHSAGPAALKPVANPPPVAKALPMPALPPANRPPPRAPPAVAPPPHAPPHAPHPPHLRPNSNVSFVLQPVMQQLYQPRLAPPPPPHVFPNYYEYGPWHFAYEPHHGNVNLNFNIPPKNLVVNSRAGSVECKNACREGEPVQYAAQQGPGCWIKPTIFYDGFWTEQKVKKWVAEQVEKQFPDDAAHKAPSPGAGQPDAPKS